MSEIGEIHRGFGSHGDRYEYTVTGKHMYCALFEFILKAAFTGSVCLVGFAANTVCFMGLWKDRQFSPTTFLTQAIIIADFAVLWMLFVGESMPALGYVLPILRDCTTVCSYVKAVSQPLLFLSHVCVIWFTMMTAINRYIVMSRPAQADAVTTVDYARKKVILIIICAVLLTLPMTFDSAVTLTYQIKDKNGSSHGITRESLKDNKWYRLLYLHAGIMFLVYVIPILTLFYVALRLWFILASLRRLRRAVAATYRTQHMDSTQVSMTLAVVLIICYLPLVSLKGVEWTDDHIGETLNEATCGKLQYYLATFSTLFLAINSSLKLVILSLFSPTFIRHLKHYWKCICCSGSREKVKDTGIEVKSRDVSFMDGMYKCSDMSEMTLISHMDTRT